MQRCLDDERAIEPADGKVESIGKRVDATKANREQAQNIETKRGQRRDLQIRANNVSAKLRVIDLSEKLAIAQRESAAANAITGAIVGIEKYFLVHPAPDENTLKALKTNRQRASRLQADRDAASISVALMPELGAGMVQLTLDGAPARAFSTTAAPSIHTVRRKADIVIQGWGRIELNRGTGKGDLDQIEAEMRECHDEFADAVTPLGIAASDALALDLILERVAEHRLRKLELAAKKKDLEQLAPKGLEAINGKVLKLQTQLADASRADLVGAESLPTEQGELVELKTSLDHQVSAKDKEISALEIDDKKRETELAAVREEETTAKEELATCRAKAVGSRQELERLRTVEQINQRVTEADRAVEEAQSQLTHSELTNEERTIDERLHSAQEAVGALETQIDDNTKKFHEIKGPPHGIGGLVCSKIIACAASRVDEITRLIANESLDKDAVDRLYALFEECREKQFERLMTPIHDRVVGWMHALDIGDYKEIRFNDAFLPDKLMCRDGTAEFTLNEESTGAQEQIGMFVRLALGSTLASPDEPAIAILDDPLTHCDVGRLNKMRVILRRAAEGDPMLTPPAGPLQILVLTCHPEWFRDERATVIDLESPDVMNRSTV